MKVLTLEQPFASIVALGLAQWITSPAPIGHTGELAIYAGPNKPDRGRIPKNRYGLWADELAKRLGLGQKAESEVYDALPRSTIIAVVELGVTIPTGRYTPPTEAELEYFIFKKGRYQARFETVRQVNVQIKDGKASAYEIWELPRQHEKEIRKQLADLAGRNGGSPNS